MSTITLDTTTAAQFIEVFNAADFAGDVTPAMTCTEADAVISMLRALGAGDAADGWHDVHAARDEDGDTHFQSTDVADAAHGTGQ